MKKIIFGLFLIMSFIVLASCTSPITITGDQDVTLKEGDTFVLDLSTDDEKGLTFESSNEEIISVDASGKITAIAEGSATVTVTSKSQTDVSVVINVNVTKRIVITSTIDEVILTEGQQETISYEANDDVSFTSSSTDVFTVDASGVVSAVAEGQASLRITSDTDPSVYLDIEVVIRKAVTLTIDDYEQEMVVGEQGQITVTSNDGYVFESGNEDVLTVSETGAVAAIGAGTTTIKVTSSYDESVEETITITVYATVDTLTIDGPTTMNYYDKQTLSSSLSPANAYPYITWTSSNEEIATIDEEGIITILGTGIVTFSATSNLNELVTDSIEVTIINQVIVDASMTSGIYDYEGLTYTYGISLFSNFNDALDHVIPYTTILVNDGQYTSPLNIDIDGLELKAIEDLVELGSVEVNAKDVSLNGFNMQGSAFIHVTALTENIEIMNITASTITQDFIMIVGSKGTVTIEHNQLSNITGDAITITGYESGTITVSHNQISDVVTAVLITPAETVDVTTQIKVERNDISDVIDGIVIEDANNIHAYARFNSVVNATGYLAQSNSGNNVEFTLNHWGMETLDMNKFDNITEAMLLGFYANKVDIISEETYNPAIPVRIIIDNPIDEIMIGDSYQFTYTLLPYDLVTTYIKWITSAPLISTITQDGTFTPIKSGPVTFTVRSSQNTSINATVTVNVVTYPGIELAPVNPLNQNLVGTTLQLEATPFPQFMSEEPVSFVSSNEAIATVTVDGLVYLHTPGIVTITSALVNDPSVTNSFTFEVYSSLDQNNILDILTSSMVTYTTPHRWTAFGVGFDYQDFKYESVSRYYFGDYEINQSKMVPVSSGIRPGEPMDPHPEGITQYNPENVYWVVIHDTANTNAGSGALAHANYLYGNAMAGVELWASWHFTIDDKALYQHIPTNERAYHAGDGSYLPGQHPLYLGGGNRNGIGIETGVNADADVYRTWQRTAKFGTDLLIQYNLPLTNMRYHVDFSGKNCPQTMRTAGLVPLFEEMKAIEYHVNKDFSDAVITFESHDLEYVDNTGRVIKMPDRAMTVSYTVTIDYQGQSYSRLFYSYLPGTVL